MDGPDDYTITFPDHVDSWSADVADRGVLAKVVVRSNGSEYELEFYDIARITGEIAFELKQGNAFWAAPNAVVLPVVDRRHMEDAIAEIARRGFVDVAPKASPNR